MSIGQVLIAARQRAGLTVREVSEDTRIRESIIRSIERDDFAGCGGDFYARGHIRAIARAVGADPRPLIEEYDTAQRVRELAAASAFATAGQARQRERLAGGHRMAGVNWTMVLTVLVVLALAVAGYFFAFGGHQAKAVGGVPALAQGKAARRA